MVFESGGFGVVIGELEYLVTATKEEDIVVIGVMFREFGPGINLEIYPSCAEKVTAETCEEAHYQWTGLLKAEFRKHGWLNSATLPSDFP